MSSRISWCVEGRVLYVYQDGFVTTDTINMTLRFLAHEVDRRNNPLRLRTHVITNMDNVKNTFSNVMPLTTAIKDFYSRPYLGWSVLVAANSAHRMMMNVMANIMKARNKSFANNADALTFLQQVDQTLPQLPLSIPENEPIALFE